MTDALVEFVLARIAEAAEEAVIRGMGRAGTPADLSFIRAGNRVLAECEVKRRIVDRCKKIGDSWTAIHGGDPSTAPYPDVSRRERSHAYTTLCDLAGLDADHPDYQQEWSE